MAWSGEAERLQSHSRNDHDQRVISGDHTQQNRSCTAAISYLSCKVAEISCGRVRGVHSVVFSESKNLLCPCTSQSFGCGLDGVDGSDSQLEKHFVQNNSIEAAMPGSINQFFADADFCLSSDLEADSRSAIDNCNE
jgi:hypothetical protein